MAEESKIEGLSVEQWDELFRPGMPEFAATSFRFTRESHDMVRIAFGNSGPIRTSAGNREPRYTHAVLLSPALAVDLAGLLLKFYAEPQDHQSQTSDQV